MLKKIAKTIGLSLIGLTIATNVATAANTSTAKHQGVYTAPYLPSEKLNVPPTNIAVLNYSSDTIQTFVRNAGMTLYSGNAGTFRDDTVFSDSYIKITDIYGRLIYGDYVCRRAMVIVDGGGNYWRTTVDRRYC